MSAKLKRERNRILLALAVFSMILIAEKTGAVPLLKENMFYMAGFFVGLVCIAGMLICFLFTERAKRHEQ